MKNFVVVIEGNGQGCDYTIDCNKTFYEIEAETTEEAIREALGVFNEEELDEFIESEGGLHSADTGELGFTRVLANNEHGYSSITMFEVSKEINLIPLALKLKKHLKSLEEESEKSKAEEKERKEFERLKKKFGP